MSAAPPIRVLVVAEYYPRAAQPALGVWAHRQALAARDAGAELRVLVLYRPLPSLHAARRGQLSAVKAGLGQPRRAWLDGLRVDYVRYLSPPRPWSYGSWGAWAAPWLRRALLSVRTEFAFDLVHAHNAVPAGDAVRRAAPSLPLLVSVHGSDVHGRHAGGPSVAPTLQHARLVLANSAGTARRCAALDAGDVRIVHLGADVPTVDRPGPEQPTLVTVADLVERKRHADVIDAVARLRDRHPQLRYVIVGDGPERAALDAQTQRLGLTDRVQFVGPLGHDQAVACAQSASLFVLPSVAEAFGVSYVEAMAAGVAAVGCRDEDGPEEIAAAGGGIELVTARDPTGLAERLDALLSQPSRLAALGRAARDTVARAFTWRRCGVETVSAYREVQSAVQPGSGRR